MATRRIDAAERRARLGRRHGLAGPAARFPDATTAAAALVGLHATDPATVFLAARARVTDFRVDALETALYDTQELIKHLAMRRTLFVLPQRDLHLVQAAISDDLLAAQRRHLIKEVEAAGVARPNGGARWLAAAEEATVAALERLGPVPGATLSRHVPELQAKIGYAPGKKWGGEVGVANRVYTVLALAGRIRRGPPGGWTSSRHTWEPIAGPTGTVTDAATARTELIRRWLEAFGPATVADIAWWTGLGLTKVRAALTRLDTVAVDLDGEPGVVLADDVDPPPDGANANANAGAEPSWVAALPALDPTAMGWKGRRFYLDPAHVPVLFDRSGNVGATLWVDGRIVGGWSQRRSGEVVHRLLTDVGAEATAAIEDELAALQRFLGDVVVSPRFPVPLDKELRGDG
ncbi:MAG: winged helix DNA-binding domain-containing protein [Acidimicrobiia bacterium]